MRRFLLPLVVAAVVGSVVITLGLVGVWMVWNQMKPPLSYEELEDLEAKGPDAAPEIPRLLACFERNDEFLRIKAAEVLKAIGPKAVEPLREKLKDRNRKVRFHAVEALAWIGPEAAPAADDVRACLSDDDAEVRFKAAYALGRIGVASNPVISSLAGALNDRDADVSSTAAEALEKIGAPAAFRLFQMLDTSKPPLQNRLLNILDKIGSAPREALPVLAKLAKDHSPDVSHAAVRLLGKLGEPAVPTIKELLRTAPRQDHAVYFAAIAQLGPERRQLLPELQTLLIQYYQRGDFVGEGFLDLFNKTGIEGATALGGALKATKNPALLKPLGDMGANAKYAVPVLIEMLKTHPGYRKDILQTLGDIGPAARDAVPAVQALVNDPFAGAAARVALRRMGVS